MGSGTACQREGKRGTSKNNSDTSFTPQEVVTVIWSWKELEARTTAHSILQTLLVPSCASLTSSQVRFPARVAPCAPYRCCTSRLCGGR